jgi:O-antigen ligase
VEKGMTNIINNKTQQKNTFIVYYQGFLAVAAVLVFFTKLDVYLGNLGIGLPLLWLLGFLFASIPLFFSISNRLKYIPIPIIFWVVGYITAPLISILILPQIPELQLFENQIRTIIFLLLMLVIFSQHILVLRWVKQAILLVTVANVLMFIYEFLNPLAFYLIQDAAGRSSGFYTDANSGGCAIILGMILSIDLIKPKYRLFYALFVFIGIATTFSRGAMIGWVIVIFLFMVNRVIPRYQLSLLFLSIFVLITILSSQLNNLSNMKTADGTELLNEDSLERVEFLINPFGGQEDESTDGRLGHVKEALAKFNKQPFIGNGLGSGGSQTYRDAQGQPQRSHNIYLDQMVEYGFLGALIYPFLLLACVWKAQGEHKKYTLPFVAFLLIWGVFSHTTMDLFSLLISYAIMANLTQQSRLENL